MHSSSVDQITLWSFDHNNSSNLESVYSPIWTSLSGATTVYPIVDMRRLLRGPSASNASIYVACCIVTLCSSVVSMLLLLLAGDVESNPGPTGKYMHAIVTHSSNYILTLLT